METMSRSAAVAILALLVQSCEGGADAGQSCKVRDDCGAELACLEGVCAGAYEDEGAPPQVGGPLRVFSVGLKIDVEDAETQESFRAAVRRVVDTDVVPHLATDRPNLLVFPENTGFAAPFIGARATRARARSSLTEAFLELGIGFADAGNYYLERAQSPLPPGRVATIAVTDTLWRSVYYTFAAMARELGVYVAVTYNIADAEQTDDAELVEMLVDDAETDRSHAWIAIGDRVPNQTLVFDPEGVLVAKFEKEYLVPDEEHGLNLNYGPLGNLEAATLPFGRVSSVISKDAWMPDVLERLSLEGAGLMMQPEAFGGWVSHSTDDAWGPDVMKEGGWSHVMRFPEFRANVLSCLVGNVFDTVFDGQSSILVKPHLAGDLGGWVGQEPDVGFAAVAPWFAEDDGNGTLTERRTRLADIGARLLPGSGAPEENGYVPHGVFLDLDLGAPFPTQPGVAMGLAAAPSEGGEQRRPALVALEDGAWLTVWEDDRHGVTRLYGARQADAAAEIGEARVRVRTDGEVRAPRVAADHSRVHLVWQERAGDGWVVRYGQSTDGGRSFPRPTQLSAAGSQGYLPHVAVDRVDGSKHAVWIESAGQAGRVHYARGSAAGAFGEGTTVEPQPTRSYNTRDNAWGPVVAARGGVVAIAWLDFRAFDWEVWGTMSADGGETFRDAFRIDDAVDAIEPIHLDVESVILDDGTWVVAWTDLRHRRPDYDIRIRRVDPQSPASAMPSVAVATDDAAGRPQWRPALASVGETVAIAWQDLRGGDSELHFAVSEDGGRSFPRDGILVGVGPGSHYGPRVAFGSDGRGRVVAEDTSSGRRRVRLYDLPQP